MGGGERRKMKIRECPYCEGPMECDEVDIGVGFTQCGPYVCNSCGASQIFIDDDKEFATEEEENTGFYKAGKVSPLANIDDSGKIVSCKIADYLYRKKCFEKHGNPYNAKLSRY